MPPRRSRRRGDRVKDPTTASPVKTPLKKGATGKASRKGHGLLGKATSERLQALARKRVTDYAARLGLGRAARRLDVKVDTVKGWLTRGFPKHVLADALAFSGSGGLYVSVRGTSSKELVGKLGKKKAAKLLGLGAKTITARARRDAPVRFRRSVLVALVRKKGKKAVAELLDTTPRTVDKARKPIPTTATQRLRKTIETQIEARGAAGKVQVARFLGISEKQLGRWTEWNVPRSWEKAVSRKLGGKDRWARPEPKTIAGARAPTKKAIEAAKTEARRWNRQAPARFRISLTEAERQARLGTWSAHLAQAKTALATSRKAPRKPRRRGKAPPLPPRPRPTPAIPKPPPRPRPRPPTAEKELPAELRTPEEIANFRQLRIEAFLGQRAETAKRYRNAPYGRTIKAGGAGRRGFIQYGKVEELVHLIDLEALGRRVIEKARKLWRKIPAGHGIMTIRFTLSALGSGNPFYPDAWIPDKDKISFFRVTSDRIDEPTQIAEEVWGLVNQIYEVGATMLLFFEHFEIARSETG